ncbi:hypothetical protein GN956_G5709 [Arapaima gigas]
MCLAALPPHAFPALQEKTWELEAAEEKRPTEHGNMRPEGQPAPAEAESVRRRPLKACGGMCCLLMWEVRSSRRCTVFAGLL